MLRMTFVIGIVHALHRLTINTDRPAGMLQRAHVSVLALLGKALAAGSVTVTGVAAAYHNVSLAAIILLIIAAVCHTTF